MAKKVLMFIIFFVLINYLLRPDEDELEEDDLELPELLELPTLELLDTDEPLLLREVELLLLVGVLLRTLLDFVDEEGAL
jgi:hypothetical protein